MKKILLTLLIIILNTSVFAQENLANGYIITNSDDTIYGQIDLRTSSINQQKCTFVSDTKEKIIYLPTDIKGYRYTDANKFYISKTITVDKIEELVFIEYLVQGGLNLFYLEHNKRAYYIFEEEGKLPIYITQKSPKERDRKIITDKRYLGELRYHFRESSDRLKKLIDTSKFNQKSMIAIAKQYNDENCLNPDQASCIVFENKAPDKFGLQAKFSVYTGIQNGTYTGHLYEGSSTYPLIGGQIYAYNPQWSKSFGVVLDLSFSKISDTSPQIKQSTWLSSYNVIDYDMYNLSAKLGLRYTYSKHKLRPSIEGGLSTAYIFKNNSTHTYTNNYVESIQSDYDIRKIHVGWYLGVGVEYNIVKDQFIFIRFNYDRYTESDYMQSSGTDHISLWQIKVGYTF